MVKVKRALFPIFLSLLLVAMIGCAKKPPTITSVSPNSGPSGGGTQITITGENFKEGATVTVGGKALQNMSISEDGMRVTGTVPGGPPGAQQVIANNVKAKEPSAPATFTYEALKVVSTAPADGAQVVWYPRLSEVSATVSQPIQSGTGAIMVGDAAGSVAYDAASKTISFTSTEPLKTGVSHTATVSGAKDMAGNTMADYSFTFTIEEAVKVSWYTVQDGDTLPIIAAKPEVYEDESKWMDIYEANQDEFMTEDGKGNDAIQNYRKLTTGAELYIPR